MKLTLAIPAHNDDQALRRLLAHLARLNFAAHVVVVDDGSDIPILIDSLLDASGLGPDQLTLLRHDTTLGAGAARNLALNHVPTEHLMFLDADDLPTRELPHLLSDLKGRDFDFCIFQHHDTRQEHELSWGQTLHDQTLWQAAGVDVGTLNPVPPKPAACLARTANYPWNKIYRTDFLLANNIGCSEIPVHNDIELHWRSFLNTTRILASDRVGVIHFVDRNNKRLTNRDGPERLEVFTPLNLIAREINARDDDLYDQPFFRFAIILFDWVAGNITPDLQVRFTRLVAEFVDTHVPPAIQASIEQADPALFDRVLPRQARANFSGD